MKDQNLRQIGRGSGICARRRAASPEDQLDSYEVPISSLVEACCRRAAIVTLAAILLAAAALFYVVEHFDINTNSTDLIAADVPWRVQEAAFDAAFPQLDDLVIVVVDGATPELAERATAALTERLSGNPDLFPTVRRPDGGPFFDRNGLLYLSAEEVQEAMDQLIAAQPLLGPLAMDPSLRGIMDALGSAVRGLELGDADPDDLNRPLTMLSVALENAAAGRPAFLSWRALISGEPASSRELRRFIQVKPTLDYTALAPGDAATTAIRQAAADLTLNPDRGVTVRLTGPVPLDDEEFATLAENAGLTVSLMVAAVLLLLWLALGSARLILPILATLAVGLSITAALGLALVGAFNLISVAFVILFVGLGVDFGIQFAVRYRAERHTGGDLMPSLRAAGDRVGISLALAAASTAVGFFAFLPTDYRGVSELGLIAGTGMIVAFLLSLTLLPALLTLARPPAEPAPIGYRFLAPVNGFLSTRRRGVLGAFALLVIASAVLLPRLQFDFNPLNLKSVHVESVSTLLDLMQDPETTTSRIDVLRASLVDAEREAAGLAALPEVDRAITLASFVPDAQEKKLAVIDEAAFLLGPTLAPFSVKPPPTDRENARALAAASEALRRVPDATTDLAVTDRALHLADILDRLASAEAADRARAADALVPGLTTVLDQARASLEARPVTLETLPPALVRDWLTPDGRARVDVTPKGDGNDNETLKRFAAAILAVAPDATGAPVTIQEAGRTVVAAFRQAGAFAVLSITLLLAVVLRRPRDIALTIAPLVLAGVLTLGTCVLVGLEINFANIIALPLLFGIGVAFNIYFVIAWRAGALDDFLQSPLTHAVLFSALTTAAAFGSLWLSTHPGTSSMGQLLLIALGWTLATTLLFLPALLMSLNRPSRRGP